MAEPDETLPAAPAVDLPAVLVTHLRGWVGVWPPREPAAVAGNDRNARPGWDGTVHAVTGVVLPDGRAALGVPPEHAVAVRRAADAVPSLDDLLEAVPGLLDRPSHRVYRGVMRWSVTPADLPDAGEWVPVDDPVVPGWLRPFGSPVLVARDDDGSYLAGVGIKRHDDAGHELSVGTEPAARGRGIARRLVAQAARAVVADGRVATYLHDPRNVASAKVADAAGFPDRGWQVLGMFDPTAVEEDA